MRRIRLLVGLGLSVLPAVLPAQDVTIPLGTRVRVEVSEGPRSDGVLLFQNPDSIVVRAAFGTRVATSTASVERIRVSGGRSRAAGLAKGARVGAIVGASVMTVWGIAFVIGGDPWGFVTWPVALAGGAGLGTAWGSVIGAAVGSERWTTVYRRKVGLSYQIGTGGTHRVGLRMR